MPITIPMVSHYSETIGVDPLPSCLTLQLIVWGEIKTRKSILKTVTKKGEGGVGKVQTNILQQD